MVLQGSLSEIACWVLEWFSRLKTRINGYLRAIALALGGQKCAKIFVLNSSSSSPSPSTFVQDFFAPLLEEVGRAKHRRVCNELPDAQWMTLGTRRALEDHPSGRAFLQHLYASGVEAPEISHFFESLKSGRRLALSGEVCLALSKQPRAKADDVLSAARELAGFDLYAGDGHFHAAAAHDPRTSEGTKYATGHFFALNLRSHALSHLSVADQTQRKKEHDMHALKRLNIVTLRQGAALRRKVLYVWDRAGIDFLQWHHWKQGSGIYFLSREKTNMALETIGTHVIDSSDPRNAGVLADEIMATSQGVSIRRIRYFCPIRQEEFAFITNVNSVPPGLLAHLYRIRWDIEKVFDQLKNKLGETKAWASSANAKTMQAHFLCIAHNLMLLCEDTLESVHGIRNEAEIQRRTDRLADLTQQLARQNLRVPFLISATQHLTQRSVKFIRWLRVQLFGQPSSAQPLDSLRILFAVL